MEHWLCSLSNRSANHMNQFRIHLQHIRQSTPAISSSKTRYRPYMRSIQGLVSEFKMGGYTGGKCRRRQSESIGESIWNINVRWDYPLGYNTSNI